MQAVTAAAVAVVTTTVYSTHTHSRFNELVFRHFLHSIQFHSYSNRLLVSLLPVNACGERVCVWVIRCSPMIYMVNYYDSKCLRGFVRRLDNVRRNRCECEQNTPATDKFHESEYLNTNVEI